MSHPPDQSDSPSHLRIDDDSSPISPQQRWLRVLGGVFAVAALIFALLPFLIGLPKTTNQAVTYALGLVMVALIDAGFSAILLTWRNVTCSKLGQWEFTVEGYQSSLFRNLILGGGMQCVAILALWLPLLAADEADNTNVSLAVFMIMAAFSALASTPWLIQYFLKIKGHDLEVYEEGLMIGGFYPCRWERIIGYHVWEDECSFITFDIRGRAPFEVFLSPIDQKLLCETLKEHVGPPTSQGRSSDLPHHNRPGPPGQLSIFR